MNARELLVEEGEKDLALEALFGMATEAHEQSPKLRLVEEGEGTR